MGNKLPILRTDTMNPMHRFLIICVLASLGLACRSDDRPGVLFTPDSDGRIHRLPKAPENDEESWGTPLYQAVLSNDVNAVRRLVEGGADVNKGCGGGQTPLHAATMSDAEHAFEIVQILVSHGADVNAKIESADASDDWEYISEGQTPLHYAAGVTLLGEDLEARSNKAVVELLLTHGAKVNERDGYGCTPLFATVFEGFHDVMELLIEHGADVNVKNAEDGGTVLHEAAYHGHLDTVTLLISHGADIHARDFDGETPLHEAALGKYQDVVHYLTAQGADLHAPSKRNETPQDFLDEPEDTEPILLPDDNERVFSLIVTDGLEIRRTLKCESIDYDSLWFPSVSDVEGLDLSLRQWLAEDAPLIEDTYIAPGYILSHFDQYNREYAGFVRNGTQYILCNMLQAPVDPSLRSLPRNGFSGIWDGGCAQVVLVFEAQQKQVVWCRCNSM